MKCSIGNLELFVLVQYLESVFPEDFLLSKFLNITCHHFSTHVTNGVFWLPAEYGSRFGTVSEEKFHFRRSEIFGVDFYHAGTGCCIVTFLIDSSAFPFYFHTDFLKAPVHKIAYSIRYTSCDHKIFWSILLKHSPHRIDIILRMSPVAFCIEITKVQTILKSEAYLCYGHGDFSCYKGLAAYWRFVVEKNTVASEHTITFFVVAGNPHSIELRTPVWTSRVHWGILIISSLWSIVFESSVQLRSGSLIEFGCFLKSSDTNRLEQSQSPHSVSIYCIFRHFKTHMHMRLSSEIVNFIWSYITNKLDQIGTIR